VIQDAARQHCNAILTELERRGAAHQEVWHGDEISFETPGGVLRPKAMDNQDEWEVVWEAAGREPLLLTHLSPEDAAAAIQRSS
jgi:hypothetical protein